MLGVFFLLASRLSYAMLQIPAVKNTTSSVMACDFILQSPDKIINYSNMLSLDFCTFCEGSMMREPEVKYPSIATVSTARADFSSAVRV